MQKETYILTTHHLLQVNDLHRDSFAPGWAHRRLRVDEI